MKKLFLILSALFVLDVFSVSAESFKTTFQAIKEKGVINEDHFKKLYGIETPHLTVFIYTGINPTNWNPYISKFNSESNTNKHIKGGLFGTKAYFKRFLS